MTPELAANPLLISGSSPVSANTMVGMSLAVEGRSRSGSPGECANDGMPLHWTIVGLRCPLCGAGPITARSVSDDRPAR